MFIKKFYYLYNLPQDKNWVLKSFRIYSLYRFIIRFFANIILPIYFSIKKKSVLSKNDNGIIISLTSFPARINTVWLVIECLLAQTKKPFKIILWLSREQFKSYESLPAKLRFQTNRGLEIRFVEEDLKSHKKFYYVFKEFSKFNIVTVDDDLYYPEDFLENLFQEHLNSVGSIISCYARKLNRIDGVLGPYSSWNRIKVGMSSKIDLFFGSGGGTFFPEGSLYQDLLKKELFLRLTPKADDIWLNAMCRLNNTEVRFIPFIINYLPVKIRNNETLASHNLDRDFNDEQIEMVNTYYRKYRKVF